MVHHAGCGAKFRTWFRLGSPSLLTGQYHSSRGHYLFHGKRARVRNLETDAATHVSVFRPGRGGCRPGEAGYAFFLVVHPAAHLTPDVSAATLLYHLLRSPARQRGAAERIRHGCRRRPSLTYANIQNEDAYRPGLKPWPVFLRVGSTMGGQG